MPERDPSRFTVGDAVLVRSGTYMRELYANEGALYGLSARSMMRSVMDVVGINRVGIVTNIDGVFVHVSIDGSTILSPFESVRIVNIPQDAGDNRKGKRV